MDRSVLRIVRGRHTTDGAGVKLIRVLSAEDARDIDPFVMLDSFDSANPDDYIQGFPMHPHRGIETITYLIEGRIDHRDSLGNSGSILGGQAQWMTAGRGILHEEMPQKSNRLYGLQIWLNLPSEHKMTQPSYYDIREDMIPLIELPEGQLRLLAGRFEGHCASESRFAKAAVYDLSLEPNRMIRLPIAREYNAFLYLLKGEVLVGADAPTRVAERSAILLSEGDGVRLRTEAEGARLMVFQGVPLNEPIAWGGPIVMNTQQELREAFAQLRDGTFIQP